ncbi:MAG TPA: DUF899 family protein [Candidatus Dormibacteraeota bacterium]|nr:DUF899 family protein [Candidatus Dormibacteraeota bacterium]
MATPLQSPLHSVRFPSEGDAYRAARNELLHREILLRKNIEEVAALRRKLPVGGAVPEDYIFEEDLRNLVDGSAARQVRMSELFEPGKDILMMYSFMYGPEMATPCPLCTSILDGLDGQAPHISQRVNFAVVAKSPLERIRAFSRERGWRNLRLLSSGANTYNRSYQGETAAGDQIPSLNVFVRQDGRIHHFYNTELLFAPNEPGQDGRHVDLIWPLWNMFDFSPVGRGEKWRPMLAYRSRELTGTAQTIGPTAESSRDS